MNDHQKIQAIINLALLCVSTKTTTAKREAAERLLGYLKEPPACSTTWTNEAHILVGVDWSEV